MTGPQERGEWTSASNAMADGLCIGRHRAQIGIPDKVSSDASFGREVHEALAKGSSEGLTVDQENIYEHSRAIEKKIVDFFFGEDQKNMQVVREHRFWIHWENGLQHSAQPDVVYRCGTKVLVLEYKTLPGDVAAASTNMQLRDQTVCVWVNTPLVLEIAAAVVQPLITHNPEITIYKRLDIERSTQEMADRVAASNSGGPRTAGEVQCKFCKAAMSCPEYQKFAGSMVPSAAISPSLVDVPVILWTPDMRKQFCDSFSVAQKWLDKVWSAMEEGAVNDPNFVPGYSLVEGTPREKINNLEAVFNRASAIGVPLLEFLGKSTISKKDIAELVRKHTKTKGKALEKILDEVIGTDVSVSEAKKSLKEIKSKR